MIKCVSIYPVNEVTAEIVSKWEDYLERAVRHGFDEAFTSLHIPEVAFESQVRSLSIIAQKAHEKGMLVTCDIGGAYISKALHDEDFLETIKEASIDFIRLDYGYNNEEVSELYRHLQVKGFVINASLYNKQQIRDKIQFFRELGVQEIRACHNYYPRVESGLDEDFARRQDFNFHFQGVKVIYFIPSHTHPRGPVFDGLPTIEEHRYMDVTSIMLELLHKYEADGIMTADEFFEESELNEIENVMEKKPIDIKVQLLNEDIGRLVIRDHKFRYDSNRYILRSESSREMSQYASKVTPFNCVQRHRGDVTVDNERYGRYSGEVEVILSDLPQDDRVNVVGHISEKDLRRLSYHHYGYTYRFITEREDQ